MSKKILFLSFYFEPDLSAGSFRNSPLAYELAEQGRVLNVEIDVFTALPNRYSTYKTEALECETNGNVSITRVKIPHHQSGVKDQINSFKTYFTQVRKLVKNKKYDLVYASSSRLFTAYLGYVIAKERKLPLYLDIRDIFVDTIKDVFPNPLIKVGVLPLMSLIEKRTFNYATHINLISGGFKEYFQKFTTPNFTEFSNGIDPVFLESVKVAESNPSKVKTIVYAGNIGEGQGLHKIIPEAAIALGSDYKFKIIGDGGAKSKLVKAVGALPNVELKNPVSRKELVQEYNNADFLFIHLNDYEAFKKVLPSKVFELGVFPKPIIAGVSGFAQSFIEKNLSGSVLFQPCNATEFAIKLREFEKSETSLDRSLFIELFKRETINKMMAQSILSYL